MKRSKLNFIIDIIAFIAFIILTTTGILMRYLLPPGSGKHSTIWSLDRHEWGSIHFWLSVAFFSILALHLIVHWRWIVSLVTGRSKKKSGYRVGLGVVGLIAATMLAISPLLTPIEIESTNKEKSTVTSHEKDDFSIRGSMTLKEVVEMTDVPTSYIIEKLELPESISLDEKLGKLKQEYGFEMKDIRDLIAEYKNNFQNRIKN